MYHRARAVVRCAHACAVAGDAITRLSRSGSYLYKTLRISLQPHNITKLKIRTIPTTAPPPSTTTIHITHGHGIGTCNRFDHYRRSPVLHDCPRHHQGYLFECSAVFLRQVALPARLWRLIATHVRRAYGPTKRRQYRGTELFFHRQLEYDFDTITYRREQE